MSELLPDTSGSQDTQPVRSIIPQPNVFFRAPAVKQSTQVPNEDNTSIQGLTAEQQQASPIRERESPIQSETTPEAVSQEQLFHQSIATRYNEWSTTVESQGENPRESIFYPETTDLSRSSARKTPLYGPISLL